MSTSSLPSAPIVDLSPLFNVTPLTNEEMADEFLRKTRAEFIEYFLDKLERERND